jgi:uncharacterized protein
MARDVLEAVVEKVIRRLDPACSPTIVWHAGEPTVVPLTWYDLAYQSFAAALPTTATFSLQTNGVAISDAWARFLVETNTHVGISIDGPKEFHDARRVTRAGKGTWELAIRGLERLRHVGLRPTIISVLQPPILSEAQRYFDFIRQFGIDRVSFSIDELEGANETSSFDGVDLKEEVSEFIYRLMEIAYNNDWPLRIREVERVAAILHGSGHLDNEQTRAWGIIVVAANGDVTTFSPEFMEARSAAHNNFCFGNVLSRDDPFSPDNALVSKVNDEIEIGIDKCRDICPYFQVCGGGAPMNKWTEFLSLRETETSFCRHSIQASADALLKLIKRPLSLSSALA